MSRGPQGEEDESASTTKAVIFAALDDIFSMGLLVRSLLRQQTGYSGDSCGFNLLDGRSWDLRSYLVQTGGSKPLECLER